MMLKTTETTALKSIPLCNRGIKLREAVTRRWYETTQKACREKGLDMAIIFGNIHVYSKVGEWYFEPKMGKIRLMHRNTAVPNFDGFHREFQRAMTPWDLVAYIHRHDSKTYGVSLPPAI